MDSQPPGKVSWINISQVITEQGISGPAFTSSLPTVISESWLPITYSLVYQYFVLVLLIDIDQCRLGNTLLQLSFWRSSDPVTKPVLVKLAQIFIPSHLSCFTSF
ncbi:hypothetical protein CHARACLAT_019440 [Characodon lateralis]|uniref:Uncharacterized protein n=1 Tax=Characodon lateralis TaxID=208331 RepID=A0ABU7DSF0_9TELE|nr:hypothetical protein [Characodon lateralis]